jgi:Mce-associated membrane protein
VEGQQPDPGDLNGDDTESARDVGETRENPEAEEPVAEPDAPLADNPVTQRRGGQWFARNKKVLAIVTSAGLFVAAGGFAAAAIQPYLMNRATVATKYMIAQTAADAITTLWSYTPEDMDTLSSRSAKYLGGDFEDQYRTFVDAIAATNKQAKVTSSTQVVGAGIESLNGDEATALVYTNTTSTSEQSNNIPSLQYLSYRLELKRYGRDWRVTRMTTVTSLDLTPKL